MIATLYKKDSKGRVQVWKCEVEGNKYRSIEGLLDGKLTTSEWTIAYPKNVGKKNETTGEAQAYLEYMARVKKKEEKGYVYDLSEIDSVNRMQVMLAHEFKKNEKKVNYPCYSQPKLDGMRCYITKEGMFSRDNKPVRSVPHIFESLTKFFEKFPFAILDGELYNHELNEDFNRIISLVKKANPNEEEKKESAQWIKYYIYDCAVPNDQMTFIDRFKGVRLAATDNPHIVVTPTTKVETKEQLDELYTGYLEAGYEGQMVRNNVPYEYRRSYSLLKRKEWMTEEFEIVDVLEGVGNRSNMFGKFVLNLNDREGTFESNALGTFDYYREIWQNKQDYIGKKATVKFQNYTPAGKPRFDTVIAIRDYE